VDDLVQWLGEQFDEDERIAQAASPGPWGVNAEHDEVVAADDITVAEGFALSGRQLRATVDHIAAHDPARVLREVEAQRLLLARAVETRVWAIGESGAVAGPAVKLANDTLRLLALPYADRPGYRKDWRPS
jgi:hypothetical protein